MKKFGFALMAILLSAGFVTACGGDNDDDDTCNAEEVKASCTAEQQFNEEKCECEAKAACDKEAEAAKCTAEQQFNEEKCECEAKQSGAKCGESECQADEYCVDSACVKLGDACSEKKSVCLENVLISCAVDAMAEQEGDVLTESLTWQKQECGEKLCATASEVTACYEKCEANSEDKYLCDPNSGEDGDSLKSSISYKCTQIGDDYLYVQDKVEECQNNTTCDTSTGKCEEHVVVEKKADGEACKDNSECSSGYCKVGEPNKNTCAQKSVVGEQCYNDEDCISNSCDKTEDMRSGKCLKGLMNGKACENGSQCESQYCDSESHVCAENPELVSKVECTSASDCNKNNGEVCTSDFKCSTSDQPGIGDKCSNGICGNGLKCVEEKCVLEAMADNGKECTEISAKCDGEVLVVCSYGESMGSSKTIKTTLCPNQKNAAKERKTCAEDGNGNAACLAPCAKAGDKSQECDPETDVEGAAQNYIPLTCTQWGDKLVNVEGKSTACSGMQTCDYSTNVCGF